MIRRNRPPVERRRDGAIRINLGRPERDLVRRLLGELGELMAADDSDPRVRRLFPTAYHDDPERDAEYQRLMREELVASRAAAIASVDEVLAEPESPTMTEEQAYGFMQSLNALRLVLGTVLDVDEAHDSGDVDAGDPMVAEHHLYDFLSWLLDSTVRALAAG